MKKFTTHVIDEKEEMVLHEKLGSVKDLLIEFLSTDEESLDNFIQEKMGSYNETQKDVMRNNIESYIHTRLG